MAEISAQLVKQLRDVTNAGFMECKKALVEADGDLDRAVDVLRERGVIKAKEKSTRATHEGVVTTCVCGEFTTAGIVEVSCETDFVSATDAFKDFANAIAKTIVMKRVETLDELLKTQLDGEEVTVEDALTEKIHTIGENMKLPRMAFLAIPEGEFGAIESYIHMGGKIGVLVEFGFEKEATKDSEAFKTFAHDVALQVAASAPIATNRDEVSQEIVDHEMAIYRAQAADSGKPENIQEKIAEGKLEKYFKSEVLSEQEFIKDSEKTINTITAEASKACDDKITIKRFVRYMVGEMEEGEKEACGC